MTRPTLPPSDRSTAAERATLPVEGEAHARNAAVAPVRLLALLCMAAGLLLAFAQAISACSGETEGTPSAPADSEVQSEEPEATADTTPPQGGDTDQGGGEPTSSTEEPPPATGEETPWEPEGPVFDPFIHMGGELHDPIRGQVVRRGTIHLHTGYSHDACDGDVWMKNAEPEEADGVQILQIEGTQHLMVVEAFHQCNQDVRAAVCAVEQDFLFHTDHNNNYPSFEYPDVLLYDETLGDELIIRDGDPVAMWLTCEGGRRVLMSAGVDTHLLAFGLERHVSEDMDERRTIYGTRTEEAVQMLKDAGALVVSGYSDEWDVDLLFALPFDGFEIYNPATNLRNPGDSLRFMGRIISRPTEAPKPPVLMLSFFQENDENLTRWATLSTIRPIFNYIGTNAHQNVFQRPLVHGERIDSFERMMGWFANYVLLPEDEEDWNDRTLKTAIGEGRHYGVFEYLGVPIGFDFHALDPEGTPHEMGARIPFDADAPPQLVVDVPTVYGELHPDVVRPEVNARLLRATEEGEWIVVQESSESFVHEVETPGAYRVDVRMVPHHLREWLGRDADMLIRDVVWIYANNLYVGLHLDHDDD